jgi:hypothetical protein
MNKKRKFKKLKDLIAEFEGFNPLVPEDYVLNSIMSECQSILESNGYIVKRIPNIATGINNYSELINRFYFLLEKNFKDVTPYRDNKADHSVAKKFVSKIMETTGYDFKTSLSKCAELVEVVFDHKEEFNFKLEYTMSFRIFGQGEMSWVTEKAIQLLNRRKHDDELLIKMADVDAENYLKRHSVEFGFENLGELIKKNKENFDG